MPSQKPKFAPDEQFGITITSPELSKKDLGPQANTWALVIQNMNVVAQLGLHTPDSIGQAITQFTQEMLELDLVPYSAEDLERKKQEAMQQMQEQQAQEAEQKAHTAQEKPSGKQPSPFQKKEDMIPKVGRQPKPEEKAPPVKNNA